jgi:hypothetical protein
VLGRRNSERKIGQAEQREAEHAWQEKQKKDDFDRQQKLRKTDKLFQLGVVVFAALVSALVSWLVTRL